MARDYGSDSMIHIGLDLGGTKISAIALDESGKELGRLRVPTPSDYADIRDACAGLVGELNLMAGVSRNQALKNFTVGVGSPGTIDADTGVVRFSPNIPGLAGKFFVRDLSRIIGAPVALANDADCFAASEARDGAGAGLPRIYGIIIGTGVGGAIAENGRVISGPNKATEWGHVSLPWVCDKDLPLRRCGCGRLGCVEAYLSGKALHRDIAEALGRELPDNELNQAIAARVPVVMDVIDVYLDRMARAFAMLVSILDPHALILGGGVSNLDIIYQEIPARLSTYTLVPGAQTRILKARFGDDSGLRGAAWVGDVIA